jgi:hypothetical protein
MAGWHRPEETGRGEQKGASLLGVLSTPPSKRLISVASSTICYLSTLDVHLFQAQIHYFRANYTAYRQKIIFPVFNQKILIAKELRETGCRPFSD